MLFMREFIETDKKAKDAEWANKMVSFIRMYSTPLINVQHAQRGMAYLLGAQDMEPIRKLFQNPEKLNLNNRPGAAAPSNNILDKNGNVVSSSSQDSTLQPEMVGVDFKSLPEMEKIRNMIIAEIKKMGAVVTAKCDDPTATIKRKDDEELIRDKETIEGMFNYIYTSVGQEPFSLRQYEARFGEKLGNGNTSEFEGMGFDNSNPADIKFFMDNFHKLSAEISAEILINFLVKVNQTEEYLFENWVSDLLAKKAIAAQCYVSKLNGQTTWNYITPETVWIYGGGRRKDFNDASAKSYNQLITIKELLDRVGDSFNVEEELNVLFQAVYYASSGAIDVTGIGTDPVTGWYYTTRAAGEGTRYNYSDFMSLKINFGYIEFISPNDEDYENDFKGKPKKEMKNKDKGFSFQRNDNQPPNGKRYQAKARYEVPTYCSYYLSLSAYEQRLFDFGEVPYHIIEGNNDFLANWTILTYKEIGDSIAINCAPFIDLMNECWYKFKYEVRRAKAAGVAYNFDSLLAIAEEVYADDNISRADKIQRIVSWFDTSSNIIYKWPEVEGKVVPMTNSQMNIEMPNGIKQEAMRWWETMINARAQMLSEIGLDAPLRQGDPGGSRDSMNNQFKALEYSQNNTYYIPDSITYMLQMLCTRSMLFALDIIEFKDYDTMAYKYLVDGVGEENLENISQLGKKAMHRYGIFVESLNVAPQKAKLQARLDLAVQNGKINNAEAMLVDEIKSPRKQMLALAYFEQRNAVLQQKNAMALQQAQSDQALALEAARKENINTEGMWGVKKQEVANQGAIYAHLVTQQGGIAKAEMKHSADSRQIYEQAHANMQEQQQSLDHTGKATPPPMIPLPTGYEQGAVPTDREPSGIQRAMAESQPMSTGFLTE